MKLSARTFLNVLIALLVVFILFHLIVPMTIRDGFEPMDANMVSSDAGDASGLVTSGEEGIAKYAKQPTGLSVDAVAHA